MSLVPRSLENLLIFIKGWLRREQCPTFLTRSVGPVFNFPLNRPSFIGYRMVLDNRCIFIITCLAGFIIASQAVTQAEEPLTPAPKFTTIKFDRTCGCPYVYGLYVCCLDKCTGQIFTAKTRCDCECWRKYSNPTLQDAVPYSNGVVLYEGKCR